MSEHACVLSRNWVNGFNSEPPRLELKLSDGSFVMVGWDSDYSHQLLFVATDLHADFVSCVASETGLDPDVLAGLVDEVAEATRAHDSNNRVEYWDAYTPDGEQR